MMANSFNPREHLLMIKNRQGASEYLPVQWRLVWFRQECPEGSIETELVHLDLEKETEEEAFVWNNEKKRSEKIIKTAPGLAIFRATVRDGKGGLATGTKMEKAASFPDYVEKAETGAIGRALAALGFGTQFAPELDESHRIVDSPVDRSSANGNGHNAAARAEVASSNGKANGNGNAARAEIAPDASATDQQVASIRKLCEHMGKSEPENVTSITYLNAKKLIQQLTAEYREYRQQNNKAS
ncbi:hypothetical protein EPA93_30890 [Ktedonosporobacter rubrisoli]|uniref:Uncharacterized protein n=1 Tax=Ktedonosporobacter rubrisoli TaxID=2509675 RepID=A0A4P6JWR3_KTERU|nr:hypothetical protein [Ktedonosporobacter rubrisoli]QBD80149.1 hypothetical protein EPA93_30890 [Ktedonosporobacter rubrisoli]